MSEREKVIGFLHETAEYFRECRSNASFASEEEIRFWEMQNTVNEAAELLKEQEGTINELQNAYGYLQKQFFEAQDKLLKEQEAVPVIQREVLNKMFVWCCGSCGVAITDGDKFCRMCGKAVKWD